MDSAAFVTLTGSIVENSVHLQIIDTNIIEEDRKAMTSPVQIWVRKDFVELIEQESDGAQGEKTRVINEARFTCLVYSTLVISHKMVYIS